jgi:hypothetical protein
VFLRTCGPNLLVEFEIQSYTLGWPEKSCSREILGRVYLDAITLQNSDPHVAGRLVTVDEQNFLVSNNWLATKWWWAIHTPPLKEAVGAHKANLRRFGSVAQVVRAQQKSVLCTQVAARCVGNPGGVNLQRRSIAAPSAGKTIISPAEAQRETLLHGTARRPNALLPSRCLSRTALIRLLRSSHAARRKANPDPGYR